MNLMPGRSGFYEEAVPDNGSRSGMPIYGGGGAPHLSNLDNPSDDNRDSLLLLRTSEATAVKAVEKEHMFDKVVTPFDVGKLNRLVIPKQHAEKYFPLDSSTNEKGLLLNFEDRNGKPWRFRYSYWNSSQSYVMTKGWSRFVKEKKLDAGDIVSFQRGVGELARHRLFIDWRRRPDGPELPPAHHNSSGHQYSSNLFHYGARPGSVHPWSSHSLPHHHPHPHPHSSLFLQPTHQYHNYNRGTGYHPYASHNYSSSNIVNGNPYFSTPGPIVYLRAPSLEGSGVLGSTHSQISAQRVFNSVPVVQGKAAAARRLRLFGVNMDCPIDPEYVDDHIQLKPHLPFDSSSSSTTVPSLQLRPPNYNDDKGKGSMSLDLEI